MYKNISFNVLNIICIYVNKLTLCYVRVIFHKFNIMFPITSILIDTRKKFFRQFPIMSYFFKVLILTFS